MADNPFLSIDNSVQLIDVALHLNRTEEATERILAAGGVRIYKITAAGRSTKLVDKLDYDRWLANNAMQIAGLKLEDLERQMADLQERIAKHQSVKGGK